jgi:hypothetical protein
MKIACVAWRSLIWPSNSRCWFKDGPLLPIQFAHHSKNNFFTYGLKMIIGEKSMNNTVAKGVLDRTFSFTAHPGDPLFDIK